MTRYERFLANKHLRHAAVLLSIVMVLWLARSVMSIILLTFIFSFLVTRLINTVRRHVNVHPLLVVAPLYLLILGGVVFVISHYLPEIIHQSVNTANLVLDFYNSKDFAKSKTIQWVLTSIDQMNLKAQVQTGLAAVLKYAGSVGAMGVTLLLSFILSFFFTSELDDLKQFGLTFYDSPFGWYFRDLKFFADKFINTFGVVIEAQIVIATVNTLITTITLMVLHFPNILGLAVMVFLLSMVPVAGAIISVIPLSVIAYTIGGVRDVITIIVLIIVIHALETYVLNPKFMASRTKLPVFFTFVVLLLADKLFGTWGLIVGIPIFTFLLDIIGVKKIGYPHVAVVQEDADDE